MLGEVEVKVISLAGITCDLESDVFILIIYILEKSIRKYLKMSNTLGKYLNTNTYNS